MMRPTWILRTYGGVTRLVGPLVNAHVTRQLRRQGVIQARLPERNGYATLLRPEGQLIWVHAASVGESLSVLRLIEELSVKGRSFLITSGTATSAQILVDRLPVGCQHQFAPIDSPAALGRFLDHWHPDAAIFVESELWPNMLRLTRARGIPMALVNARISDRSARSWGRVRRTARYLLSQFTMIHCQDAATEAHIRASGVEATQGQNLKALASPLPVDKAALKEVKAAIGKRPIWCAVSTHPGEEELILAAHKALIETHPKLLLILVPRHPERGEEVARLMTSASLDYARRSTGAPVGAALVYLADTLGETGLWYATCPISFIGGSLMDMGGHNPYEPAQAGSAIVHGPYTRNFAGAYAGLAQADAALEVSDSLGVMQAVGGLLRDSAALKTQQKAGSAFAKAQTKGLSGLAAELSKALSLG